MVDEAPQRVVDRILNRVDKSTDCWLWPGAKSQGYGHVSWSLGNRNMVWGRTHRILYTALRGPIPNGYDLDHLCHDPKSCAPVTASDCPHRQCCNPDHLEPVTRQVNLLRGGTVVATRSAVTHCPAGHEYTGENTIRDSLNRRNCKQCVYERNRAYYWKNRERRRAYNKEWHQRRALLRSGIPADSPQSNA